MNKKRRWALWISIILVIVFVAILFFYFALYSPNYDKLYAEKEARGEIKNPVLELTDEEAIAQFNEDFVFYILYSIKAYNLHSSFGTDYPKIEFFIDDDIYNAVIKDGEIKVGKGEIKNDDIIIKTSKKEGVKMLRNRANIQESFSTGSSEIELVASKSILFAKGYLNLYTKLTGKSITGGIIKIYTT